MKRFTLVVCSSLVILTAALPAAAQGAHGILVSYTQSPSPGITANSIYRGTVTGGPYTRVFVSSAPITSWLDTTGVVGTVYCYVSTANVGSNESGFSNERCLPFPPSPPTNEDATKQ